MGRLTQENSLWAVLTEIVTSELPEAIITLTLEQAFEKHIAFGRCHLQL